jgi:Zn-dependent protease
MLIVFFIIILGMSVIIHEISHGYVAYMQGDPTAKLANRLTLNPLPHIDLVGSIIVPIITSLGGFPFGWAKPVPFNPYNLRNQRWGELYVAIAGPLSNLFIALIFGLIIRFGQATLPGPFIDISALVVWVNISLAIFNLIPIPPLDGSKIVGSLLPFRLQQAWRNFERYSFVIIVVLILIPQFSNALAFIVSYLFFFLTHLSPTVLTL